jgi:phosphohistidine phosphatase SixA
LVLYSSVNAAKETAEQLTTVPEAAFNVSAVLAPDRDRITLADLEPDFIAKPKVVAVVGHIPA